jgi:hypothetical protein
VKIITIIMGLVLVLIFVLVGTGIYGNVVGGVNSTVNEGSSNVTDRTDGGWMPSNMEVCTDKCPYSTKRGKANYSQSV